jgi:hypothetical protein
MVGSKGAVILGTSHRVKNGEEAPREMKGVA